MIAFDWSNGANKNGDKLSRTSLPENFYKNTGEKLINLNIPYFKYNPFCIQEENIHPNTLSRVEKRSLWRYSIGNTDVSNCKTMAHEICKNWGLDHCYKTSPDVYIHKDLKPYPRTLCINTTGRNQGAIPLEIINQIRENYSDYLIIQIGGINDVDANCDIDRRGVKWEDSAKIIAESEIFIGVDSFCYWLSVCYPKTRRKIILVNKDEKRCETFTPRGWSNEINPFDTWIEGCSSEIFNIYKKDIGMTKSYMEI